MIPYDLMDKEIIDKIDKLCNFSPDSSYSNLSEESSDVLTYFILLAEDSPLRLQFIYGDFNDKKSGDAIDFFDNIPQWHNDSICLYGIKKYVSIYEYTHDDSIGFEIDICK